MRPLSPKLLVSFAHSGGVNEGKLGRSSCSFGISGDLSGLGLHNRGSETYDRPFSPEVRTFQLYHDCGAGLSYAQML
jgi:hypothetical protein